MHFQDLNQFLVIALAHLLAVISPGPDFALITRQSFLYGRTSSIYTSLGIASGILVHVFYCIVGLNFLLTNNDVLFYIRIVCAIYLFYLGIKSLLSHNIKSNNNAKIEHDIV